MHCQRDALEERIQQQVSSMNTLENELKQAVEDAASLRIKSKETAVQNAFIHDEVELLRNSEKSLKEQLSKLQSAYQNSQVR